MANNTTVPVGTQDKQTRSQSDGQYQPTAQMAPAGLRKLYQQQKYDPRMTGLSPLVKGLSRGFIAQDLGASPFDGVGLRRFSFLFNPSELSVSYASDGSIVSPNAPGTAAGAGDVAIGAAGGTTLSLSLLVDRTYETWSNQQSRGVMEDIHQLEKMTLWSERNPFIFPSQMCHLFLGPVQHFFGAITQMDVLYTSWTQYLVPNRASVTLQFQTYSWQGDFSAQSAAIPLDQTNGSQAANLPGGSTYNSQVPVGPVRDGGPNNAQQSQTAPTANPTGRKTPIPHPSPTPP